tara:strand:+ start:112 stop:522 length:411 start_codon:yes stop_codon:yes gene_type:complete
MKGFEMMELKNVYISLTNIVKEWFSYKFFSVTFVKKNGEVREMLCKMNPQNWKGKPTTNGGSLNWNPTDRGYLMVFDVINEGWRMVNFHTIKKIRFGRKDYHFNNFNHFLHFMLVMGKLQKVEKLEKLEGRKLIEV